MLQNIILALVIVFLMTGAFFWMWKLSKWLVIPIQIILFILLLLVVFKVFVTKDNAERLNKELEKSQIVEVEKKAVSGTMSVLMKNDDDMKKKSLSSDETPSTVQTSVTVQQENRPPAPLKKSDKSAETKFVDLL